MLDNFPHVKAFWIMQTLPMAQLMLQNGADDIDGTVVWYDITHVGGAGTHQEVNVGDAPEGDPRSGLCARRTRHALSRRRSSLRPDRRAARLPRVRLVIDAHHECASGPRCDGA
jgi:hypothetical protein